MQSLQRSGVGHVFTDAKELQLMPLTPEHETPLIQENVVISNWFMIGSGKCNMGKCGLILY